MRIKRDDIHLISRFSNWSASGLQRALQNHLYPGVSAWQRFLRILFFSLGVGLTVAGLIFFFAYNWASLHKFVKLGMLEGMIVTITIVAYVHKIPPVVRNIILTGAAMLVGALFAVFGQIYQTGANAYDFFLGWTLAVTIWVIVLDFSPLWLVYLVLLNTTLILYHQQVAFHWHGDLVELLLLLLNSLFFIGLQLKEKLLQARPFPREAAHVLVSWIVVVATFSISAGFFDEITALFFVIVLMTAALYAAGIMYGLKTKRLFYLSIIPFSTLIILVSLLVKIAPSDNITAMLLFISLLFIGCTTMIIKFLITLQKKWRHE